MLYVGFRGSPLFSGTSVGRRSNSLFYVLVDFFFLPANLKSCLYSMFREFFSSLSLPLFLSLSLSHYLALSLSLVLSTVLLSVLDSRFLQAVESCVPALTLCLGIGCGPSVKPWLAGLLDEEVLTCGTSFKLSLQPWPGSLSRPRMLIPVNCQPLSAFSVALPPDVRFYFLIKSAQICFCHQYATHVCVALNLLYYSIAYWIYT